MEKRVKWIINGFFSIITTALLMASPVLAVVYAAEPAESTKSFGLAETTAVNYVSSSQQSMGKLDLVLDDLYADLFGIQPNEDKIRAGNDKVIEVK